MSKTTLSGIPNVTAFSLIAVPLAPHVHVIHPRSSSTPGVQPAAASMLQVEGVEGDQPQ